MVRSIIVENEKIINIIVGSVPGSIESNTGDIGDGYVDGQVVPYTPPPVPLETLKAQKKTKIEQERDAACTQDVSALGYTWQADERSQKLLSSALTLAQAGAPLPQVWMSAENVPALITDIAQLVTIAGAMAVQTEAAYQASWLRKQALLAATTPEEVAAV